MERLSRLRAVLEAAKGHPVYREKFKDLDPKEVTLEDLKDLPLTTREEWVAFFSVP